MECHEQLEKISTQIIDTLDSLEIPKNGVIVYDIDYTLLDGDERPIYPIIKTYYHALNLGLQPIIVTARIGTQENINRTISILKHYGISKILFMYFRPPNKYDLYRFKLRARQHIHERGYIVLMSIGDMPWDIGEYGGIGVKLPQC